MKFMIEQFNTRSFFKILNNVVDKINAELEIDDFGCI